MILNTEVNLEKIMDLERSRPRHENVTFSVFGEIMTSSVPISKMGHLDFTIVHAMALISEYCLT